MDSIFKQIGNEFYIERKGDFSEKLPPGIYSVKMTMDGRIYFSKLELVTDSLVNVSGSVHEEIVQDVAKFSTEETRANFKKYGVVHKRGYLMHGPGGCHERGAKILMFDGSIKNVEDVVVGDQLMGPDSRPRNVLNLARGREQMVKIVPTKGESFVVNLNHILSLKNTSDHSKTINITVKEYLEKPSSVKKDLLLYRTGVDFAKNNKITVPPYILGLWLGDGLSRATALTTMDTEIADAWRDYATSLGLSIREEVLPDNKAKNYFITSGKLGGSPSKNPFQQELKLMEVLENKHIPKIYLNSDRQDRLNLLAGLIDTDGSNCGNYYEITQKRKVLADDILYLARSLGFAAYMSEKVVNDKTYYRITISGDLSCVPVKLSRKKCTPRKQKKSVLVTGFDVELLSEDDYFGFALDSDHLYLMGDFTVTHNTGKTVVAIKAASQLVEKGAVILFNTNPDLLAGVVPLIRENNKDCLIGAIYEEFDDYIKGSSSTLLSVLDGELQVDNFVVIACTNYITKIPSRVKNRPSRFARVIEVGVPSAEFRREFFKAKLDADHQDQVEAFVETSEGMVIDQMKDLIISVYCMGETLASATKKIKEMQESSIGIDDYQESTADEVFVELRKSLKGSIGRPPKLV